MITSIAENIAAFFVLGKIIPEEKQDLLRYGMEIIISTIIGTALILITGIIFKMFWYSMLFLAIFVPLRQYTGGYHAETYLQCDLKFVASFLILILVFKFTPIYLYIALELIITVTSFFMVAVFAPIDNKNKRLDETKKRKFKKISIALIITLLALVWILYLFNYKMISFFIALTVLVVAVLMILGKIKNITEVKL